MPTFRRSGVNTGGAVGATDGAPGAAPCCARVVDGIAAAGIASAEAFTKSRRVHAMWSPSTRTAVAWKASGPAAPGTHYTAASGGWFLRSHLFPRFAGGARLRHALRLHAVRPNGGGPGRSAPHRHAAAHRGSAGADPSSRATRRRPSPPLNSSRQFTWAESSRSCCPGCQDPPSAPSGRTRTRKCRP